MSAPFYLVGGLGNPGSKYAGTRHNAGFDLVDHLAQRWGGGWSLEKKLQARVARVDWHGRRVILCQPQTYMNLSGQAVSQVTRFYRIRLDEVMIVVDDADLVLGKIRLRWDGRSGGHHGIESVEGALGSREFARLRVGIGRTAPQGGDITGHVLGRFDPGERETYSSVLDWAAQQVECWLTEGLSKAMSRFNGVIQTRKEIQ